MGLIATAWPISVRSLHALPALSTDLDAALHQRGGDRAQRFPGCADGNDLADGVLLLLVGNERA